MERENKLDLLAIRNATFISEVSFYDELESTNSTAIELSVSGCVTPHLIITNQQTGGRGRGQNQWWSSEGALTFTVLLELSLPEKTGIGPFSLTAGLAICQGLERFAPTADLAIKWPNDVLMNQKKVCGILIEKPAAATTQLSIGIGINVNNELSAAPTAVRSRATSVRDELQTPLELTAVLIACLQQLETRAAEHVHNPGSILDQWRSYCHLKGREVAVQVGEKLISGICRGIDDEGALLVDNGTHISRCVAGVVTQY